MSKKHQIGDPMPDFLEGRPTTQMKCEWENACARLLLDKKMPSKNLKNYTVTPGSLLMYLR